MAQVAAARHAAVAAGHDDAARPGDVYALDDLAVASRLAFFLWSQGPDDRLLELAGAGKLREPVTLAAEVKRMLADRFQEAIDMAAMRGGASDTDSYLADWRRAEPVAVGAVQD